MSLTIPDQDEPESIIQSLLFQETLEIIVDAIDGLNCVLSGCAVTAQGTPDMTVAVAKGAVLTNGVLKPVTAGNVTVTAADATNPRIDLIVVNSSGTKACRAGTAAAAPKPPARTANDVVIAQVYVPAAATTITTARITDRRMTRTRGPILLYKTTTAETTNTSASAVHILDKTNSGVVIPSGLLAAGKILRCRIGGDMLMNSGTPTGTLTIAYGGTTLFADVTSIGWTADTDRRAFFIEFDLAAEGLAVQRLAGCYNFQGAAGYTAAATGLGDIGGTSEQVGPIFGSATVDSDAADRTLAVTFTMSVSNLADEIRVGSATLELIG